MTRRNRAPSPAARRRRRFPVAPVIAAAVVLLVVGLYFVTRPAAITPYAPPELPTLSPDLRSFVQEHLDRARAKPTNVTAQVDFALSIYFNELTKAALPNFINLEKLLPDDPHPRHYQAHCYRRFGDLERAAAVYDEVAKAHPKFAPAFYERGRLAMERSDWDAAERDFEQARSLAPTYFDGWLGLGDVAVRREQYEKAREYLEKANQLEPKDKVVLYQLGLALRGLGRKQDAEKKLAAGSGSVPRKMHDEWSMREYSFSRSVSNMTSTAIGYIQQGDVAGGVALLEKLYAYNPGDVEVLNNLASAYQDAKQPAKATALLNKALEKEPNRDATLVNFASLHLNLGDYAKAIEYADRALKSNPSFSPAFMNKGNALARLNKYPEAVVQYKEAIRFDPKNGKARCALGSAYSNMGRLEEALREIERGVEIEPEYLSGHLLLVDLYLRMPNKREAAEGAFSVAKKLAPNNPEVVNSGKRLGR